MSSRFSLFFFLLSNFDVVFLVYHDLVATPHFHAFKAWPKLRPGYNAATQCQRRVRGNAGRQFTRELRVVVAKAKASLAAAMGFGRLKTLQRCFRGLRSPAAARVIQRQWRSLVLRRMAQETLVLLRKRRKRVRRLMRRLLGPIATRAL